MPATAPAHLSLKTSAFDGALLHFNVNLPSTAVYGPGGKRRDFSRVEGMLGYVCDIVNAHRQSVTFGELRRWGDELSELLRAAIEGGLENPSNELLADIGARFEKGVQSARRLERASGGVALRFDANIAGADGFYALLAVLLMHPKCRQLIRRCPQCGKLFVRAGKRRFCAPECATAANDAGVLKRQKNQRLRRAAQGLLSNVASEAKRAAAVNRAFKEHPDATAGQLADYARALIQTARKHK